MNALISAPNSPAACAASAFWCDASANASWSSRETFHCAATFSAVRPMPYAMPMFSSRANTASLIASRPSIGIMLMLSVPAAIMMSASPVRIRSAAIDTAFSPEEQNRLIVMPATLFGRPASSTPMRATFMPCSNSGIAQPTITSSIRLASIAGTCASTLCNTCASSVSGRVERYAPRGALPTAVRVAATMYASCICLVMV